MIIRSNKINEAIEVKDESDIFRLDKEFRSKFYPRLIALAKSVGCPLYAELDYHDPGSNEIHYNKQLKTPRPSIITSKSVYYNESGKVYLVPYHIGFKIDSDKRMVPSTLLSIEGSILSGQLGIFNKELRSKTSISYFKESSEEVLGPDKAKEVMKIGKDMASYLGISLRVLNL